MSLDKRDIEKSIERRGRPMTFNQFFAKLPKEKRDFLEKTIFPVFSKRKVSLAIASSKSEPCIIFCGVRFEVQGLPTAVQYAVEEYNRLAQRFRLMVI